jgi:hypothetical protein
MCKWLLMHSNRLPHYEKLLTYSQLVFCPQGNSIRKTLLAHDRATTTYRWVEERLVGATKQTEPPVCPICYEQICTCKSEVRVLRIHFDSNLPMLLHVQ